MRRRRSGPCAGWASVSTDTRGLLRRRIVTATAVASLAVAALLVLVVQVSLERTSGHSIDRVLAERADGVTNAADASVGDQLVPPELLGPGVAVYADSRLVAGGVPPALADDFDALAGTTRDVTRHDVDGYQLLARPFEVPGADGERRAVVVVSESLAPYESQERAALVICLVAGALLVLVTTGFAAWAGRRALAPVAAMARTADEWSASALDRRFDLGEPTDEIRALGRTLDGLLERVSRAIADEQRLTSELAHELRTPLTTIQATVEVVSLRDDLDDDLRADLAELLAACRAMGATITGLLEIARSQAVSPGERPAAHSRLESVVEHALRMVAEPERVDVDLPPGLQLAVRDDLAARALSPLLDNALRHGRRVRLMAEATEREVTLVVADDGPGVAPELADRLFEPGHTDGGGSGLGLALARRVARGAGGDVVWRPAATGGKAGAVFAVSWPRFSG